MRKLTGNATGPKHILISKDSYVWIDDEGCIRIIDPPKYSPIWPVSIWRVDPSDIEHFIPVESKIEFLNATRSTVYVYHDRQLFVASHRAILVYSSESGAFLGYLHRDIKRATAMCVVNQQLHIVQNDDDNTQLQTISALDGKSICKLGRNDTIGFWEPTSICTDGNSLFVADRTRVTRLSLENPQHPLLEQPCFFYNRPVIFESVPNLAPYSVTFRFPDQILVCDYFNLMCCQFDTSGKFQRYLPSLKNARRILVKDDLVMYTTDGNGLFISSDE